MKETKQIQIKTLDYEGYGMSFDVRGNDTMGNANQMAKPFGKNVHEWLKLQSTKEFFKALEASTAKLGQNRPSLIETREGRNGGTWLHRNAALEFARWLNPMFAVWLNEQFLNGMIPMSVPTPQQPSAPKKPRINKTLIEAALAGIRGAKELLNLSDTACAGMLNNMYKAYELPCQIPYLPSADEQPLGTMTELLKEHGFTISTNKVNKLMVEKGLAKLFTHKGHKGDKVFPVLVGDGLKYGKNDINPNSPKTTQPHYLRSMFLSLMSFLGISPEPQQLSLALVTNN